MTATLKIVEFFVTNSLDGTTLSPAIPAPPGYGSASEITVADVGIIDADGTGWYPSRPLWVMEFSVSLPFAGNANSVINIIDPDDNRVLETLGDLDGKTAFIKRDGFVLAPGLGFQVGGVAGLDANNPAHIRVSFYQIAQPSDIPGSCNVTVSGGGGGGSGTVTSVSGGEGIVISGNPAITPVVNNRYTINTLANAGTALAGRLNIYDPAAVSTINLPNNPPDGTIVQVKAIGTNVPSLTVNAQGGAETERPDAPGTFNTSGLINIASTNYVFIFDSGNNRWLIA